MLLMVALTKLLWCSGVVNDTGWIVSLFALPRVEYLGIRADNNSYLQVKHWVLK